LIFVKIEIKRTIKKDYTSVQFVEVKRFLL